MNTTLLILSSAHKDNPAIREKLGPISGLAGGDYDIFYHDGANSVELKKVLLDRAYGLIVIGFPSLYDGFPEMQVIRSLAYQSRLVVYLPEVDFAVSKPKNGGSGPGALDRWYSLGRTLQLNICRVADLVVTGTEREAEILGRELPGTAVVPVTGLTGGGGIPERKRTKKVSIVILTFNQLADTRRCMESLEKHTAGEYELIFVDNGSVDETKAYLEGLKAARKNVRALYNETNLGFSKANNQGIAIAGGDYILLLNNDVVLTAGWLDRLIACAESDPHVGVVGPRTNHASGQQVLDTDLPLDDQEIQRYASSNLMKNAGSWFETHRVIGFCMLIKREVIEKVGGLDERFGPGGFEDYDFCLRVNQAGYWIMIAGDVFIYHIGGQGYTHNNLDYDKLRQNNVELFIEKWCRKAMEVMESMPNGLAPWKRHE